MAELERIAFMIMPFNDEVAEQAYNHCIKGVCESHGLIIKKANEMFTVNPIWDDIMREIQRANVIIVDISGRNPNVFYELGIAHTLKQGQTIVITHDNYDTTPFDVAHFRILRYENTIDGVKKFESQLISTLDIIEQDLKTYYSDEFTLVTELMIALGKNSDLCTLIGVKNSGLAINMADFFDIEFYDGKPGFPKSSHPCSGSATGGSAYGYLKPIIDLGYLSIKNDTLLLTKKGYAFAEFLEEKGWMCHYLCGHILTSGYVPHKNFAELIKGNIKDT